MKKFLASLIAVMSLMSVSYASVSFSPLEMLQNESQNDSASSSSALASVLNAYNPEDFITCDITGSPEVVRGKADTFRVNAAVSFNTELYYNKFIPELTKAIDTLAEKTRNTSSHLIELYDKPEPFGPRFYAFSENNAQGVSEVLAGFRRRALRVQGVTVILQDSNMNTLHRINKPSAFQYFIFGNSEGTDRSSWTIAPLIMSFTDNKRAIDSQLVIPVEFEIPSAIISDVKNMKAEVMTEPHESIQKRQGWLGVSVVDVTRQKADYAGLPTTEGAMINSVAKGGSAEKAGLKHGDVILMLNSERVINGVTFAQKVGTFKEGDVLTLIVNRDGKTYNVKITLSARPQ